MKSVVEDVFSVEVAEHRLDANSRAHPFQALSAVIQGACDDVQELARERGFRIVASQHLPDFLVPPPEVSVSARYENGEGQVAAADNGVGIPPPDQARIFRRYEKGNTLEAGQGLGLFLAREAVTQLGGRIWVDSEPGRGSTFYFTLAEPSD